MNKMVDYDTFSDVYKSIHGVRPRHVENIADRNYHYELEREQYFANLEQIEFDATVVKIMEIMNVSKEDAVRIAKQQEA